MQEYEKKLKRRNTEAKKTGGGPPPVEPTLPSDDKDEPLYKQFPQPCSSKPSTPKTPQPPSKQSFYTPILNNIPAQVTSTHKIDQNFQKSPVTLYTSPPYPSPYTRLPLTPDTYHTRPAGECQEYNWIEICHLKK